MEIESDDDDPFNKSLSDRLGSLGGIKTEPDIKPTIKEKKPRKPRAPKDPSNKKSPKKGVSTIYSFCMVEVNYPFLVLCSH